MIHRGRITHTQRDAALKAQADVDARLGEILRVHGELSERAVQEALAEQFNTEIVDFSIEPPDPDLLDGLAPETCFEHAFIPWKTFGDTTIIATFEPAGIGNIRPFLNDHFGKIRLVIASPEQVKSSISALCAPYLSETANTLCPPKYSCRSWAKPADKSRIFLIFLACATVIVTFPRLALWAVAAWIMVNLVTLSAMRLAALFIQIAKRTPFQKAPSPKPDFKLPTMSILVPLYREAEVLPRLVSRINKTDYPRELLDICLILEETDDTTRSALETVTLPHWFQVVTVPESTLKTKPRAMNYAIKFCKGSIIGIYDAEDDPDADQLRRIAAGFAHGASDVACIQGYLDFYNARHNWLARCFTIEYAIWFRVFMHGIEKMHLPVPLGGTTVFFRREALEHLGAWDAHNVTEDADLGFRLARLGYRCEFMATTTREEANCRVLPWLRQRSRWLKGYAMTWMTHMRNPLELLRDLGPIRFLTFQILLLGTLSNFLLAPVIWSLWLASFGLAPDYAALLPGNTWTVLVWMFVGSEIILTLTGMFAVSGRNHRHLMAWVLTMPFYWPLATFAAYKAMYEVLFAPFFWDKTRHGHLSAVDAGQEISPDETSECTPG